MRACKIELTQGKWAIVDASIYEALARHKWTYSSCSYAVRGEGPRANHRRVYMHRIICPTEKPYEVDHIDGDKLNNRSANLRAVLRGANTQNKPPRGKLGLKGVCFHAGKYIAQISYDKVHYNLGRFTDMNDAAQAYDEAALKFYGPQAYLNFPLTNAT